MYTDPNNISNLVARMEKSGLIERIPFPEDKRQNHLRPTAMGIAKFNETRPVAEQLESQVMKAIDPKKKKGLFEIDEQVEQTPQCRKMSKRPLLRHR